MSFATCVHDNKGFPGDFRVVHLALFLSFFWGEDQNFLKFINLIKGIYYSYVYYIYNINNLFTAIEKRKREFVHYSKRFSNTLKDYFRVHDAGQVFVASNQLIFQTIQLIRCVRERVKP